MIRDIILLLLVIVMFILSGFCGREFEKHRDPVEEQKQAEEVRSRYEKKIADKKGIQTEETNPDG